MQRKKQTEDSNLTDGKGVEAKGGETEEGRGGTQPPPSRNGNLLPFLDGIRGEKGGNGAVGKKKKETTTKKVSRGGGGRKNLKLFLAEQ